MCQLKDCIKNVISIIIFAHSCYTFRCLVEAT